jgi:hypothetical protein
LRGFEDYDTIYKIGMMIVPSATSRAEQTNVTCSKCKGLALDPEVFLFTSSWPNPPYRHHESYSFLSSSARNGCGICHVISEVLLEDAIKRGRVVDLFICDGPVNIAGIGDHDPNKSDILVDIIRTGKYVKQHRPSTCLTGGR